ncbi:hypothetical protein [Eubacterium sp.]|uniref:hypothetical protein n=1 Tax=Eubacterium sp. TaxID=142586 RepID=UPI003A8F3D7D
MRLLASEQISSNRKFKETYVKQNKKKKKKEVNNDFHKMLIDEQEQLDQLKYYE